MDSERLPLKAPSGANLDLLYLCATVCSAIHTWGHQEVSDGLPNPELRVLLSENFMICGMNCNFKLGSDIPIPFRMQPDLLRRGGQDVSPDDPEAARRQAPLRVQPQLGGQPVRDGRLCSGMCVCQWSARIRK